MYTKEIHEDHEVVQAECPWCHVAVDSYLRTGDSTVSGDVKVQVIRTDSVYRGMRGTLVAVHDSGTHMVAFPNYDIGLPFGASEIAIVSDVVPETELRAVWGDR